MNRSMLTMFGVIALGVPGGLPLALPPAAPVAEAAMRGDGATVRALVASGADVNVAQGDGMTALHWAANRGDSTMAVVLLRAKARLSATTRIGGYTPLHVASQSGAAGVVRALLAAKADARAVTTDGATAMHLAAVAGVPGTITALVAAGGDVNATEPAWGQTPLMAAAARGRADAVRALLKAGADPSVTAKTVDIMASAAQDRQAKAKRDAVLAQLREAQGQSKNPNWLPSPQQVQAAVKASREVEVQAATKAALEGAAAAAAAEEARLAAQGGRGLDDDNPAYNEQLGVQGGHTALLLAVREGQTACVDALLDGGADINQVSRGDQTSPMLMASINGHYDLVLRLLKRGGNPNLASAAGAAPLFAVLLVPLIMIVGMAVGKIKSIIVYVIDCLIIRVRVRKTVSIIVSINNGMKIRMRIGMITGMMIRMVIGIVIDRHNHIHDHKRNH